VRAVLSLCEFYPGICLITEEKAQKNLSQGKKNLSQSITGVQLDKKHWYEHIPKSAETSQGGKVTILWNQQVQTDRIIPSDKPDIICDNEKRT
jgi:hypothetical protein